MTITFQQAISKVIDFEGGYVNDPNDPGGETKYGISKRAYPNLDIASLTVEDATSIYQRDYWDKIGGDSLPSPLNFLAFDCAVNQGVERAKELLALTTSAGEFAKHRLSLYQSLPGWQHDGAGWSMRLVRALAFCLESQ